MFYSGHYYKYINIKISTKKINKANIDRYKTRDRNNIYIKLIYI